MYKAVTSEANSKLRADPSLNILWLWNMRYFYSTFLQGGKLEFLSSSCTGHIWDWARIVFYYSAFLLVFCQVITAVGAAEDGHNISWWNQKKRMINHATTVTQTIYLLYLNWINNIALCGTSRTAAGTHYLSLSAPAADDVVSPIWLKSATADRLITSHHGHYGRLWKLQWRKWFPVWGLWQARPHAEHINQIQSKHTSSSKNDRFVKSSEDQETRRGDPDFPWQLQPQLREHFRLGLSWFLSDSAEQWGADFTL